MKKIIGSLFLPWIVFAQPFGPGPTDGGSFDVLDRAGSSFFFFVSTGFKILLVASFLATIGFGAFILLKKVRAAMQYAKQSGDEDPAMAGVKAAVPWGIGLFLFIVLVMAVLNFVTGGAFVEVVQEVLLGGGGGGGEGFEE